MSNLSCNNCIHNEVCYKRKILDAGYANNCGDYCDPNMIVEEIRRMSKSETRDTRSEQARWRDGE